MPSCVRSHASMIDNYGMDRDQASQIQSSPNTMLDDAIPTIIVRGPFRQWQPTNTNRNKREASCSEVKHAGPSSSTSPSTSDTLSSSVPPKNTSRAHAPQLHRTRICKPRAKDQHSGPTNARSPPRKNCGFCRSLLGPNAVCLHPSRPQKVTRSDRLLVRASNSPVTSHREKSAPVRGEKKTREKLRDNN
ncbi:hypothetical protein VMCG_04684 [Cytospora schulzeri]|uniref:Uncharacterized protein n=1 Tax=Cytospora schulzeri TaxID=448051 RepID=A0A423WSH2_9PEZI|nr:hypothetical protein VMCG_04684 [Valsa malicola]